MTDREYAGATKEVEGGDGEFFDDIAGRYDLLNRILSLGLDGRWRRRAVDALELCGGQEILDLATGTADLAIAIATSGHEVTVVGIDPSRQMLDVGRDKVASAGLDETVHLKMGDGQQLDVDDDQFDRCAIAFGIRNFPNRLQGLREIARVVRPGGRVAILELSEPRKGAIAALSRLYVRRIVPRIGALLSGSEQYRYLQESIAAFPPTEEFEAMMSEAGFHDVETHPLTFGVVNLFVGRVGC